MDGREGLAGTRGGRRRANEGEDEQRAILSASSFFSLEGEQ